MADAATFPGPQQAFKQRTSLESRLAEVNNIKTKFPRKVPVIVERHKQEKDLPYLDKTKFLVPEDLSMCQFFIIIRYASKCWHKLFVCLSVSMQHGTAYNMVYPQKEMQYYWRKEFLIKLNKSLILKFEDLL